MPIHFPEALVKSPLNVLCFYDEDVLNGRLTIHHWQAELLNYLGKAHALHDPAIQAMLLAANGSGKSQIILAPFAVWMAMRFTESLTVITTASGNQLDNQDLRYVTRLARKVNSVHKDDFGVEVFDCKYRNFKNNITDSFIDMFATDEPGKAEGRHPLKHDGEFAIIVDEGKTVADDIFAALDRCTGFTRRLDVSSPGKSSGYYYSTWNADAGVDVFKKRVTAFDCPHIPAKEIEQKIRKYGLHDPLIRSSIFAEFTSTDEQVVIPRELLQKNINLCNKIVYFGPLRAGLDLASGGDETFLSVWRGNQEVGRHSFRNKDTAVTVLQIIEAIESYKGQLKSENIYADDGGIGRSMLDNLREKGYTVKRVLNQGRPFDVTRYANKGTEMWFNFKRFVEEFQISFLKDDRGEIDALILSQLGNRYFTIQSSSSKIILESKEKARKQNHPSPDRADAIVLAWFPFVYPVEELSGPANAKEDKRGISREELITKIEDRLYKSTEEGKDNINPRITEYKILDKFSFSHASIYNQANSNHGRKNFRRIYG